MRVFCPYMSMFCPYARGNCVWKRMTSQSHLARCMVRGRNEVLVAILGDLVMSWPRSAEGSSQCDTGCSCKVAPASGGRAGWSKNIQVPAAISHRLWQRIDCSRLSIWRRIPSSHLATQFLQTSQIVFMNHFLELIYMLSDAAHIIS